MDKAVHQAPACTVYTLQRVLGSQLFTLLQSIYMIGLAGLPRQESQVGSPQVLLASCYRRHRNRHHGHHSRFLAGSTESK
jgi:hypothetical protein